MGYSTINGKTFIDYSESDLRFTGWEDECIIIDRTENHYLIPIERYAELKKDIIDPLFRGAAVMV